MMKEWRKEWNPRHLKRKVVWLEKGLKTSFYLSNWMVWRPWMRGHWWILSLNWYARFFLLRGSTLYSFLFFSFRFVSFLFFSFLFFSFLLLFLVSCEGLEESSVICGMLGYFCFGFFCHQHNENQIKKYENSSPVSAFSTRYLNNTLSLCMISSFR